MDMKLKRTFAGILTAIMLLSSVNVGAFATTSGTADSVSGIITSPVPRKQRPNRLLRKQIRARRQQKRKPRKHPTRLRSPKRLRKGGDNCARNRADCDTRDGSVTRADSNAGAERVPEARGD